MMQIKKCPECGRNYAESRGYNGFCSETCWKKHQTPEPEVKAEAVAFDISSDEEKRDATEAAVAMAAASLRMKEEMLDDRADLQEREMDLREREADLRIREKDAEIREKEKDLKLRELERQEAELDEKENAERRAKIEAARAVTSPKSYDTTMKLCLFGGIIGLHRWYVEKKATCIIQVVILVLMIRRLIADYTNLVSWAIIAAVVVFWLDDIFKLRSGKFTDRDGHTVRKEGPQQY